MYPRVTWNSWFSFLSLPGAGIAGMNHHAFQELQTLTMSSPFFNSSSQVYLWHTWTSSKWVYWWSSSDFPQTSTRALRLWTVV
jgi:hypothetical protein